MLVAGQREFFPLRKEFGAMPVAGRRGLQQGVNPIHTLGAWPVAPGQGLQPTVAKNLAGGGKVSQCLLPLNRDCNGIAASLGLSPVANWHRAANLTQAWVIIPRNPRLWLDLSRSIPASGTASCGSTRSYAHFTPPRHLPPIPYSPLPPFHAAVADSKADSGRFPGWRAVR